VRSISLSAGLLLVTVSASAFEAGEKVAVIRPTEMTSITGTNVPMTPGALLTVQAVEGERLKVLAGRMGWIEASAVMKADKAEDYFSSLIRKNQMDASALLARGKIQFENGDHDRAISDLDQCLGIAANSEALTIRGFAWKRKGDKEKAMSDFNDAIKIDPHNALAWRVRGATWAGLANYDKALAEYTESIRLDPENPDSLHHRATMLSVCPDDKIRNGKQALADATKACEVSDWKSPIYLSGFATAYAELGDFDLAVKWLEKAIELSPKEQQAFMKGRLEQFRQHKPIRSTWR
jgi:tetratricopeptide (TPR) repeat protein